MSQAEALLQSLTEDVRTHNHVVADDDTYFIINPETREIERTSRYKNVLMQFDHNSETYTFELPRYVEGHDMTLCNRVRVHFNNVDGKTNEENADVAELNDLTVCPDDDTRVVCSWTVTRQATQLVGTLNFLVQYECIDDAGESVYEWHTDIYTDVEVKKGRNNSEQSVIEYSNVLEQWYQRIFGTGEGLLADIESAGAEQIAAITTEGEKQVTSVTTEGEKQVTSVTTEGEKQINVITAEGEKQKEAVELKGAETLATIPEDYTTTYNMAEEALRRKANVIEMSAEGESIFVNDSADAPMLGLNVYGKTTQFTTTGKNLLQNTNGGYTQNGITFTKYNDGSVKVSGTATATTTNILTKKVDAVNGNRYILSGCPSGGKTGQKWVLRSYNPDGTTHTYDDEGNGVEIDFTNSEGEYNFSIVIFKGVTIDAVFYPMLRLASIEDNTYEPYTGGMASPNPEYPQELTIIEKPTVNVYGGNLVDLSTLTAGANTSATVSIDGYTITAIGGADKPYTSSPITLPMDMLRGKTVILKADSITNSQESGGKGGNVQLNIRDSVKMKYVAIGPNNLTAMTTIPVDVTRVDLNIYTNNSNEVFDVENTTIVNGLRLSIIDIDWEPYKSVQALTIDRTLLGIPVTESGNYTDANGQQWICDEIDFERGMYVQRLARYVFDGSDDESWSYYDAYNGAFMMSNLVRGNSQYATSMYCNYAKRLSWGDGSKDTHYCFINGYDDFVIGGSDVMALWSDVDAWKTQLTLCPCEVVYRLESPIETELTEEEIARFKMVTTHYHNTTVMNDSNSHMVIDYAADTKLFFENSRGASDEQVATAVDTWLTQHFTNAEGVSF